jgi:hypothetical protein
MASLRACLEAPGVSSSPLYEDTAGEVGDMGDAIPDASTLLVRQ